MGRLQFLRNHFFAGLLVIIPLAVIGWMMTTVFKVLRSFYHFLPQDWQPEALFEGSSFSILFHALLVLGLALLLATLVSLLGWTSKQYLGSKILEILGDIIQRIPVIRSVYSALDQLLRTMAAGGGQQFSRVVYIEYPRKGVWALAFVTGPAHGPAVPEHHLNVYVPTTPNPTSGFHLIVPEAEVRESHLRVEEAFKTLLSLGIAQSSESSSGRG